MIHHRLRPLHCLQATDARCQIKTPGTRNMGHFFHRAQYAVTADPHDITWANDGSCLGPIGKMTFGNAEEVPWPDA
jgi:hypothetical protein